MKSGFTLLELLIVIAIFFLLTAITLPVGWNFYKIQILNKTQDEIVSFLKLARNNALAQKNNSDFGVYIAKEQIVLFQGASYDSRQADKDIMFPVSKIISFSGLSEIDFNSYNAQPSQFGLITISLENQQRLIQINELGTIDY